MVYNRQDSRTTAGGHAGLHLYLKLGAPLRVATCHEFLLLEIGQFIVRFFEEAWFAWGQNHLASNMDRQQQYVVFADCRS